MWDGQTLRVVDRPDPQPEPGEAVVRVRMAGICSTDLEILRGYMNFRGTPGHEFVGEVEAGPPEWRGQRVVGEINLACGCCTWCTRGLRRHCPRRRVLGILDADGAFAERVCLPVVNLHRVPDALSDEAAVFVEPLAAAFEILEQVPAVSGLECVVLGDGKLGLLVAQVLRIAGARVTVVGRHPPHLAIAARRGTATALVDEWVPEPVDLVVEATGSAEGVRAAVAAARARGVVVLKSTVAATSTLPLAEVVVKELTLVGSRCGPFEPAIDSLARGAVVVDDLVAARYRLADGAGALRRAAAPGTLKVLLTP